MSVDRPITFPIKLLLIPTIVGVLAWGVMAKVSHGGLSGPSFLLPLGVLVLVVVLLLELVVVPIAIRRLSANPALRTVGNFLVVILVSALLLFQLALMLL